MIGFVLNLVPSWSAVADTDQPVLAIVVGQPRASYNHWNHQPSLEYTVTTWCSSVFIMPTQGKQGGSVSSNDNSNLWMIVSKSWQWLMLGNDE